MLTVDLRPRDGPTSTPGCRGADHQHDCNVFDPLYAVTAYTRDPRIHRAKGRGLPSRAPGSADISYLVRRPDSKHSSTDAWPVVCPNATSGLPPPSILDSNEGVWNSGPGEGPHLGYKLRHKEGYFPCPPPDQLQDHSDRRSSQAE